MGFISYVLARIDSSLQKVGYSDRSSFIRDAIVEKLQREGVEISYEISLAPSRAGKGGRPPLNRDAAEGRGRKLASTKARGKFKVPGGATPSACPPAL